VNTSGSSARDATLTYQPPSYIELARQPRRGVTRGICVRTRNCSTVPLGSDEPLAGGVHVVAWDEQGPFIPTRPAPNDRTPLLGEPSVLEY